MWPNLVHILCTTGERIVVVYLLHKEPLLP